MIKKRKKHIVMFVLLDILSAASAWAMFFVYRKYFIEPDKFGYQVPIELNRSFFLGLMYIPIYWVILYFLSGQYKNIWRNSRIKEVSSTFSITIFGVVLLFFLLLLDDEVKSYQAYYKTIITLFTLHFCFTILPRLLISSYIIKLLRNRKIGFNTIVIGNNQRTLDLVNEIEQNNNTEGFLLKGFANQNTQIENHVLHNRLNFLGIYNDLPTLIEKNNIEEVIIGIESSSHQELNVITNLLEDEQVSLHIIPDLYDMRSGNVKVSNVTGFALIEINQDVMPQWQKVVKRIIDILASIFVFILFLPVYLFVSIAVKASSSGPILFKQIRIGFKGKPFYIHKFRSMYIDAENEGPLLSKKNDKRITPVGKILRKYRLDEIPQFYNVLIGEMSLVGPRPERKFFIDQIVLLAPHYKHLLRVKPGITSWGQVKYGYAENVEQMVERLKFDILYIENRSIAIDVRILIYTILIILQGRGK